MSVTWCPSCGARLGDALASTVPCAGCGYVFAAPVERAPRIRSAADLGKFMTGALRETGLSVTELKAWRPAAKPLTEAQLASLQRLAADPSDGRAFSHVGFLRKLGLVGKVIGRDAYGSQKTTSPITDAGRAALVDAQLAEES